MHGNGRWYQVPAMVLDFVFFKKKIGDTERAEIWTFLLDLGTKRYLNFWRNLTKI